MKIAQAPRRNSKRWTLGEITWDELQDWVANPAADKESGNYLLGTLSSPERSKRTIVNRSAITLDADDSANPHLPDLVDAVLGCAAIVHTTFSSTADHPRYRVIIPLAEPLLPDEYAHVTRGVMELLGGVDQFDAGSAEPERYMFRPAARYADAYRSWVFDGEWFDPAPYLRDFNADLSSTQGVRHQKRNPFELEGAVGAFNRAYDIQAAIDTFDLPYVAAEPGRWTLEGTRAVAGLNLIGDGLVFSHHITDPAYGFACSAFDLVRVHRFGELDADAKPNTPVNKLPSQAAMLDFASKDHRVVAEVVGVDFEPQVDDGPNDHWKLDLKIRPKDGSFLDCIENWDLIAANDPVMATLRYNDFIFSVEATADLPWRRLDKGGPVFTDTDRFAFGHYIERTYAAVAPKARLDGLIDVIAQRRWFNPVKEYLDTLEWDGTPRVETSLPGVRPTPYTRMVARKCLAAAVARIYEPGCKWDHTLIFYGKENLGKTFWIDRLSKGYSSTLGWLGSKDTLLTLHRSWIMVSDEGFSLKKADSDALKEFLTRRVDVFRMPYARETMAYPRRCVIWGTTNDEVFLRRQEGNRRFLIVRSEDKVDFGAMTEDYIDQLWAEAVHLYRSGEPLWLSETETELAAEERELYTEEDATAGIIEAYLDLLVPDEWDEMSIDARRVWLENRNDGLVPPGTRPIDYVSSVQLWTEALGKKYGEHRRTDLLDLVTIMRRLPGWRALPGRTRVPNYGPQFVFERIQS